MQRSEILDLSRERIIAKKTPRFPGGAFVFSQYLLKHLAV
jgi:hypothetical protein